MKRKKQTMKNTKIKDLRWKLYLTQLINDVKKYYTIYGKKNGFVMAKSIHSRYVKCAKCQIFDTFDTPNTKTKHYQMF